jgi:hypothetical protein
MVRMYGLVSAVAVGLFSLSTVPTPASADAPFNFESAPGRLPKGGRAVRLSDCHRAGYRGPDVHGH